MPSTDPVRQFYSKYPFPPECQAGEHSLCEAIVGQVIAACDCDRPRSILDLGCGTGVKLKMLSSLLCPDIVVGADFSLASLREARCRLPPAVNLVAGDIENLRLEMQFELMLCVGVLHHLRHPQRMLRNCRELLAEEGTLVLWVYSEHGSRDYRAGLEAIEILAPDPFNPELRLEIALALMQADLLHGADLERVRQYPLQALMDTFAHPRVSFYKANELIEMAEAAGYTTVRIVSPDLSVLDQAASAHEEALIQVSSLALAQRARLAELLDPCSFSLCMAFRRDD